MIPRSLFFLCLFVTGFSFSGILPLPAEELSFRVPGVPPGGEKAVSSLFKFWSLGWSKKGHFAYLVYGKNGGRIYITDTVEDKALWHSPFLKGAPGSPAWARFRKELFQKMENFRIISGHVPFRSGYEVRENGEKYILGGEKKIERYRWKRGSPGEESIDIPVIQNFKVSIYHETKGKKNLFLYHREGNTFFVDFSIKGYVKSPYENRIAVIVIQSSFREEEGVLTDPKSEVRVIGSHLEAGFNTDRPEARLSPLSSAVLGGQYYIVKSLLRNESLKPFSEKEKTGLLFTAARLNLWGIVTLLLKYGADIRALDEEGESILHMAAAAGAEEVFSSLGFDGIPRTLRNHRGQTPADLARLNGHQDLARRLEPAQK